MGLLMDTLEDSSERAGQFLSSLIWTPSSGILEGTDSSQSLPTVECPLCPTLWLSDQDLQDHVFEAHRRAGDVYLRLNGRLVGDLSYLEGPIDELRLSLLGTEPTHFELQVEGHETRNLDLAPGRHRHISGFIPSGFVGRIAVVVHGPILSKTYEIHSKRAPTMDVAALDRAIDELQQPLLSKREPHWAAWKARYIESQNDRSLERRYLAGFFEYLLGASLDQRGDHHAGDRFEQAFGYLRPFRTDLSHTARCILALKMNWFSLLGACSRTSHFWPAYLFFWPMAPTKTRDAEARGPFPTRHNIEGLWVDSFVEQLLEAVLLFHKEAYAETARLLEQLWENPFASDPNNEVKLWLLEARTLAFQNMRSKARKAYAALCHHPLYGAEAQGAMQ